MFFLPISVCSWTFRHFWFYVTGREKEHTVIFTLLYFGNISFHFLLVCSTELTKNLLCYDQRHITFSIIIIGDCSFLLGVSIFSLSLGHKNTALSAWPLICPFDLKNLLVPTSLVKDTSVLCWPSHSTWKPRDVANIYLSKLCFGYIIAE